MVLRTVVASVSFLVLTAVACAGDIYAPAYKSGAAPISPWAGFYIGGHAGAAWSGVTVSDAEILTQKNANLRSLDVLSGGQLGYNAQRGNIILGLEADLGGFNVSGSKTTAGSMLGPDHWAVAGRFYGDMTGRLGYTTDRTLLYAKGGAAFLNMDGAADICVVDACAGRTRNDYLWGWTAGGGIEQLLSRDWSIKIEYQRFDFGGDSFRLLNVKGNLIGTDKLSPTADAVTAGANYHF